MLLALGLGALLQPPDLFPSLPEAVNQRIYSSGGTCQSRRRGGAWRRGHVCGREAGSDLGGGAGEQRGGADGSGVGA